MTFRTASLLCAILLLGACDKSDNKPAPKMFKDQIDVLDQAKTVEGTLQKQNEEQRKKIKQQTR